VSIEISVLMSVRNGENHLHESIKSILNQSYKDFEFLIFNDGSVDKTKEILSKFAALDPRIKIYHNDYSAGLPHALNKLIKRSRGTYIARMDADDVAENNRLQTQLNFMRKNPSTDICFTKTNLILENGEFLCTKWFPKKIDSALLLLPYINYFVHPSCFLKKECFEKHGLYNEKFLKAQDWELWQRFIKKGVQFSYIPETLMNYRIVATSNSSSLSNSGNLESNWLKAKLFIINHHKLEALKFANKISKKNILNFYLYILVPRFIFTFLVILNKHLNKSSVHQKLLRQDDKQ
tara:strand:+ start:261 stop:1139 length:879 start_codon:yes stop_codon:yes gene_type:complete